MGRPQRRDRWGVVLTRSIRNYGMSAGSGGAQRQRPAFSSRVSVMRRRHVRHPDELRAEALTRRIIGRPSAVPGLTPAPEARRRGPTPRQVRAHWLPPKLDHVRTRSRGSPTGAGQLGARYGERPSARGSARRPRNARHIPGHGDRHRTSGADSVALSRCVADACI